MLCVLLPFNNSAQGYFDYNQDIQLAYQQITNLNLELGQETLDSIMQANPNNLAAIHLENYIDFLTLFIFERDEDFKRLKGNKKKRLQILESKGDKADPYYHFAEAEILLMWALNKSKFDELVQSARELYQAYYVLEKAKEQFPEFLLYNKSLSIIHALIETVPLPGVVKNLIGISGSIDQGLNEISSLIEFEKDTPLFNQEAEVILTFIKLYQENKPSEAWKYFTQTDVVNNTSPLARFVAIKVAQRSGNNAAALEYIHSIKTSDFQKLPYLYFLKGLCLLRKVDSEAISSLNTFVTTFEGRHYIKEAYQKIAWGELILNDNIAGYKSNMNKVQTFGYDTIDDDKQAQKEADKAIIPHPDLLKARLLFDGGYYQQAFTHLIKKAHLFYYQDVLRAEYLYRLGRISQKMYNYPDAISNYTLLLNNPIYEESFFACNAALQLGVIFESQNQFDKAQEYFTRCLKMDPDDYRHSLHQKAKSGLLRLKGKS